MIAHNKHHVWTDHLRSKVSDLLYCCVISSATTCSGHSGEERGRIVIWSTLGGELDQVVGKQTWKTQTSSMTELGMPGGGICPLQPLLPEELLAHLRRCQGHWGGLDQVQGIHCASGGQELWSEDYRCLLLGNCCPLVGWGSAEAVDSYRLVRRAA